MSNEEIKKLIEKWFLNPPANVPKWSFSEKWKISVCKKVGKAVKLKSTEKDVKRITEDTHKEEYDKQEKKLKKTFIKRFYNLEQSEVEDVVMVECAKFSIEKNSYDPTKGINEEQYLFMIIEKKLKTAYNKKRNILTKQSEYANNTETVYNPNNEDLKFDFNSYLKELRDNSSASLVRVVAHLYATNPNIVIKVRQPLKIKHSFPSRDFLLKDVPSEFIFLRDLEDYRLDVAGYSRYERIVEAKERQFMLLAIELLKECRVKFENELDNMVKEAHAKGQSVTKTDLKKKYPLLSAVAVDKNGDIIKTAFKGETGCMEEHCEYTLFEDIFSDIDRERMKGGTLYVTLEPCNRRGTTKEGKAKIPCAVRCVEAGISKIYIGTHDPDDTVKWNGANTIKTGTYFFEVDDKGNPVVADNMEDKEKKIEAAKALMNVFDGNLYPYVCEGGKKTYTIGNCVEVHLFHPDLSLEIIQLNKEFLKGKEKNAFVSFDMPE